MAPPHAKGASRSVRFSNTREYASLPERSTSGTRKPRDNETSEDEASENEADVQLLPLKKRNSQSSSKSNEQKSSPIDVPDNERDTSKRIEELLASSHDFLPDAFDTDLEDGDSNRSSLALSDDYGQPSDKGALLKHSDNDDRKRFDWRSLFRLHSWWNVLGLFTLAIVVVWLAIKGLPWSSAAAAPSGFVGHHFLAFPRYTHKSSV